MSLLSKISSIFNPQPTAPLAQKTADSANKNGHRNKNTNSNHNGNRHGNGNTSRKEAQPLPNDVSKSTNAPLKDSAMQQTTAPNFEPERLAKTESVSVVTVKPTLSNSEGTLSNNNIAKYVGSQDKV